MAHKTGTSSTKNSRDSKCKNLGLKCCHFESIKRGAILVRQRGFEVTPGINVKAGVDHTLYAISDGFVLFYNETGNKKKVIHVLSQDPKNII